MKITLPWLRDERGRLHTPLRTSDASAGQAGSESVLDRTAGLKGSKDGRPAPLSRRLPPFKSWDRPGKKLRWDADGKVRMKMVKTEIFEADVLDPYPGMSPGNARAAWASKKPPFVRKPSVKYGPILTTLAGMSAETRKQAATALATSEPRMKLDGFVAVMNSMSDEKCRQMAAAITASESPDNPYRKTFAGMDEKKWRAWQARSRAASVEASLEYRAADAARILSAAAQARGETFDPSKMIPGPSQERREVKAGDLKRAAKASARGGPRMSEMTGPSAAGVDRYIGDPVDQFEG